MRRNVLGMLEGLNHGLLLALLLEAGLAVGIDASLGDDVCAGAGCRDGSAKSVTGRQARHDNGQVCLDVIDRGQKVHEDQLTNTQRAPTQPVKTTRSVDFSSVVWPWWFANQKDLTCREILVSESSS